MRVRLQEKCARLQAKGPAPAVSGVFGFHQGAVHHDGGDARPAQKGAVQVAHREEQRDRL